MMRIAGVCLAVLFLSCGAMACQTCMDKGEIEKRDGCRACNSSGKVFPPKVVCAACSGRGVMLDYRGEVYRGHQGTRQCKMCRGGGFTQPDRVNCQACGGQGVLVTRIPCPACKGVSAAGRQPQNRVDEPAPQTQAPAPLPQATAPKVQTVQVETCTRCGPDGKIRKTVVCDLCEAGYNHKKETVDGKDVSKCRKCGKICSGRFVPCECKTPDCPSCGGKHEASEAIPCDQCGGDKIITPFERSKLKQSPL